MPQFLDTGRKGGISVQKSRILNESDLKKKLRVIPDWPKKGVNFIDITTLLKDPAAFRFAVDALTEHFSKMHVDVVVGIEARGFAVGAPVAQPGGGGICARQKKREASLQETLDRIYPGVRDRICGDASGWDQKRAAGSDY